MVKRLTRHAGQEAVVILDQTPFYAESGGQVGDKGELKGAGFSFAVSDTQKYGQAIGHIGKLTSGSLKVGDACRPMSMRLAVSVFV
jgi:alanyl-tRNA synthetase